MFLAPRRRVLAVERDNAGQDAGNLLRRIKLACLFARTGGELADQVFVCIAQRIAIGGEIRQTISNGFDDGAELGIAFGVTAPQFF